MSEFRAALQALVDAISKCPNCSMEIGHGHQDEFTAAKALLARPEPKTYLHLEGYELANAYECLGGDLETDVTICSFAEAKDQETGEQMPAGMYLSFTDYPEEGRIFLSATEAPPTSGPVARPEPEPMPYTINPAPDAAAPMSPGKIFTALATYVGMPAAEPEPRITREEAIALINRFGIACCATDRMEEYESSKQACLAAMLRPEPASLARPLSEWNEEHGFVVWWKVPIEEPSWIGSPTDSDWPGYHTHWTPHPALPSPPAASDGDKP